MMDTFEPTSQSEVDLVCKMIDDPSGCLSVIEFPCLSFVPKRVFIVTGVPSGQERGNHAHYETEQLLVCIQGTIQVRLFDGRISTIKMLSPGQVCFVPKMIWDSQVFESGRDILLVLASTLYDPNDYILDRDKFIEKVKANDHLP